MTEYKKLYDSVFSKIKDYDLAQMSEDTACSVLKEYLLPAIADFECCSQDLSDRDDERECFNFELNDSNFEILSNFMVINYLDSSYIRTSLMLRANMSSSDFHKYDSKDMLGKLIDLRDAYIRENRRRMINLSFRKPDSLTELMRKGR